MRCSNNGVVFELDDSNSECLYDCNHILDNREKLLEQFERDGFLYLRDFLDREAVLNLREYYFSLFPKNTILKAGTTPKEGVFSGNSFPIKYGVKGHPAYDFVRSKHYKDFLSSSKLPDFIEFLLGSKPRILRRKIVRSFDNKSKVASKAHVDFSYLDKGSDEILTAWIPIGDCSMETGGLVYLKDSHKTPLSKYKAKYPEYSEAMWITPDLRQLSKDFSRNWLVKNYQAGDLVIHNAHLVHASLDCQSDMMRLSTDVRFATDAMKVDPRWLDEWSSDDGY